MSYSKSEVLERTNAYFEGDELAPDVFMKYALRDFNDNILEADPDQMHRRLAKEFARIESKYPNPMSEDTIYDHLKGFKEIVPQGSPMSGIGNPYQLQSLSNCFVIDQPHDSYGGILFSDQEQVQIMKRRGGVGMDVSNIRPKGQTTSNAARTTDGIGVFMERFSNSTREVAQGGRRGALMLTIDCRHPEIETFIDIKRDLKKVTGANISIRFTDEFMQAVESGSDFTLRWPVESAVADAQITKLVNAKQVWDKFIDAAWTSAEPGALFWDTVVNQGVVDCYRDAGYKTISTNPCITGDSLIAVADGRNAVPIAQLAAEGKDVPVYSVDIMSGKTVVKMGRNPRLTGEKKEIWKLTLDDGSTMRATPDHRILLKDLTYKKLCDLQPGDSIVPFNSFNSNGYRQICNTGEKLQGEGFRNRRQYRLIYEFLKGDVDAKTHAIHHVNFDSLNDSIDNLSVMLHEDHRELHASKMRGTSNPYHRMDSEWQEKFASHPGEQNGRYSGFTNDQLIEIGQTIFRQQGQLTRKMWTEHARAVGAPLHLSNEFRFGKFSNFKSVVINNHKVLSVELVGYEDVFNITVDDNHNYFVITSGEDERFVESSGICVKNCGEIPLSPYDSCRLMVVNLTSFVNDPFTDAASFDFPRFDKAVHAAQRLMDDLVDLEVECVDRILEKIEKDPQPDHVKRIERDLWNKIREAGLNGRRTGLGITGLGDALAALNHRYGSDSSISMTELIYKHLAVGSHYSSLVLAKERGAFPVWDYEKEKNHTYLNEIMRATAEHRQDAADMWKTTGRRNIALTTTAPVGSVSCLTRTTSGIEPAFLLSYKRRRKITQGDLTSRVDYVDPLGDKWQEYTVYHHWFKKWMDVTGKTDPKESPYWGGTANDIDWVKSVDIQAAAQKWIDHSISKTCNLPNSATRETVADVYMRAWKSGCKGFTVYRDGCRTGVLVSTDEPKKDKKTEDGRTIPKRAKSLPCDIHRVTVRSGDVSESWLVLVGLNDGKPYEVFCGIPSNIEIPKKYKSAMLIKNGKKDGVATYNLQVPVGDDDHLTFKDVVTLFDNPTQGAFSRTISLALRHEVPLHYIVEQIQKDKTSDMFSFSKVIARVLKGYITDGTKSSEKGCPSCGNTDMIYQEGCLSCPSCSYSKCS
jgi:ribonucleotide reductase alpha subunit